MNYQTAKLMSAGIDVSLKKAPTLPLRILQIEQENRDYFFRLSDGHLYHHSAIQPYDSRFCPKEILPDEAVRDFLSTERARLGNHLYQFDLSWQRSDAAFVLVLTSIVDCGDMEPQGRTICLGEVSASEPRAFERLQKTGRGLFTRIHAAFPEVRRRLGKNG